jgi:hypothetical protein
MLLLDVAVEHVLSIDKTNMTAGESINISVTALDQYNNTAADNRQIVVDAAGGNTMQLAFNLSNGSASVLQPFLYNGTTSLSLSSEHGNVANMPAQGLVITVIAAGASYLEITSPSPSTIVAGNSVAITAVAFDQFANVASGFDDVIELLVSGTYSGHSSFPLSFLQGVAQWTQVLTVAEAMVLTVNTTRFNQQPLIQQLTVMPGKAGNIAQPNSCFHSHRNTGSTASYTLHHQTSSTVDEHLQFQVEAVDSFGNLATGENGSLEIQITREVALTSLVIPVSISAGQVHVNQTMTQPGNYSVRLLVSSGILVPAATVVVVQHGQPIRFIIDAAAVASVDSGVNATVTVLDQYNNTCTRENRDCSLFINSTTEQRTLPVDIENGERLLLIIHPNDELVWLSVRDTQGTGFSTVAAKTAVSFLPGI